MIKKGKTMSTINIITIIFIGLTLATMTFSIIIMLPLMKKPNSTLRKDWRHIDNIINSRTASHSNPRETWKYH